MLFCMADPNSMTGLIFHEKVGPGGPFFHGTLVPWTEFFRNKIPNNHHTKFEIFLMYC